MWVSRGRCRICTCLLPHRLLTVERPSIPAPTESKCDSSLVTSASFLSFRVDLVMSLVAYHDLRLHSHSPFPFGRRELIKEKGSCVGFPVPSDLCLWVKRTPQKRQVK